MTLDLLINVPVRQTTPARAHALDPIVPIGLPCKEENSTEAIVEPHKGIDPLAYYFALEFLTPMAEAFRIRDRHWRVGSRYCSTLEEVIQAITDGELLEPEG